MTIWSDDKLRSDIADCMAKARELALQDYTSVLKIADLITKGPWMDVRAFGAKCDGITDDTASFQAAINSVKESGMKLIIPGSMLITSQITIDKSIWLEGLGEPGHNHDKPVATIIFSNGEVDGNGNATKSLFRIEDTYAYKLQSLKFKNITVIHNNQTPKNQHTIYNNGAMINKFSIATLTVYNATGSIIFLNEKTLYHPEMDMIEWNGITGINVGGIIGQSGLNNTWVATGYVRHINAEVTINPVSPQAIICDFSGFRNVTFESFIFQGNGAIGTHTALKFTCSKNIVNGIWIEYPVNPPLYFIDSRDCIILNNLTGVSPLTKIKAVGRYTIITFNGMDCNDSVQNIFELVNGAQVQIKKAYSAYTSASFGEGDNKRPFVPTNLTGRVKVENANNWDGGSYSHDISIPIFQLTKGIPFRVVPSPGQKMNSYVTIKQFGPSPIVDSVLDVTEGRVIRIVPTGSDMVNNIQFDIKIPSDFIGSSLTVGVRYKIESSNAVGDIYVPIVYEGGSSSNTSNGIGTPSANNRTSINCLNKRNVWINGYFSIGETASAISSFFLYQGRNLTTPHVIYISDIQINLGSQLPSLRGYSIDPVIYWDNQKPTVGYFVTGDIIYNDTPAILGTAGSKYILNGWRRITTGTGNSLNQDWVEMRTLTGV